MQPQLRSPDSKPRGVGRRGHHVLALRAGLALAILASWAAISAVPASVRASASDPSGQVLPVGEVRSPEGTRTFRSYDAVVLSQHPVMFLRLGRRVSGPQRDLTGHGHNARYRPISSPRRFVRMPDGEWAIRLSGQGQYLQVRDSPALSVPLTGVLTVSVWIRPDVLEFPRQEGTGYVNYLGKSEFAKVNQCEYELRMYSKHNTESPERPNRLSAYAFNLPGGEGSGAYVQEPVRAGRWMMIAMVINTVNVSQDNPTGYVSIYKNGVLRQTVALSQFDTVPTDGTAPFRIGCSDLDSYFDGAIGKVAVFDRGLSPGEIWSEYTAMIRR